MGAWVVAVVARRPRWIPLSGMATHSPVGLPQPLQLLQRADGAWHRPIREARFPIGVGHLADIDVASPIQRQAVRGNEPAGLQSGTIRSTKAGNQRALRINNRKARAQV